MSDETIEEADRLEGAPHPREHGVFVGHAEAEASVLRAWQSGRLPHAFLIGGPEGVGKATIAYRIARFVLAYPEPDKQPRQDLSVAEDHPVSRQVAALSHPDLLVLRRVMNEESKKLYTEIRVGDVRRIVSFFGSTPAFGGYRVCIVDSIEEMNPSGLNALLKLVEEPPAKSIFLIISHAPGRVMATIRSRCQRMRLNPLSTEEVSRAVTALAARMPELPHAQIPDAAAASGGSVRRALELLLGEGLEVRSLSTEMLEHLPSVDPAKLHTLGDHLKGDQELAVFTETIEDWLAVQATRQNQPPARLARYAETWEKVRRAAIDTDAYRLERKPFVFQIFAMLADATRR